MASNPVRYIVTATLRDVGILDEYVNWLKGGHVQLVVAGGARSAEVVVLDSDDHTVRVESIYLFDSRAALQAYFDGPALELREDGKRLWMDTGKVSFSRRVGNVVFSM
eukprot:gene22533-27502_t